MSLLPPIILKSKQYRLSRVYTGGGQDYQTYNKVILLSPEFETSNIKFVEGFGAFEFIIESYKSTYQFRKQTTLPIMLYDIDRFKIIGSEISLPQIRSWLSITIVPAGFQINEEHDIFSCRIRDIDASHGDELETDNCEEYGTNTNIKFYEREVRSVPRQRDVFGARVQIIPTPPPEKIGAPLVEKIENE